MEGFLASSLSWAMFPNANEEYKENQVAFEQGMLVEMGQLPSIPFIVVGLCLALGLHRNLIEKKGGARG